MKQPAPLLVNLPGYGSYISSHPQINDDNYNILHISPLGYVSPAGPDRTRAMEDGNWPVLPNTAMGLPGAMRTGFWTAFWPSAGPSMPPE